MSAELPVVDCDVHAVLGSTEQLLPYLDEYWSDALMQAGCPAFVPNHHPPGAPITERPDATRDAHGRVAHDVGPLLTDVLDRDGADRAILQCLYCTQHIFNPQMEQALTRALNTWIAEEWLPADDRLRASIVVPLRGAEAAVEEIEHWAGDPRFVQVLVPVQSELAYGREAHWPMWEAAERAGLPIAMHLGGPTTHVPTVAGWPSTYLEWYVAQQAVAEAQISSVVCAGIFQKYPAASMVLCELGFRWLPAFMWRLSKLWKGLRRDVPWVDRLPSEIIREHVRLTTAPSDGAEEPGQLDEIIERLGSDRMLLFASDYPHWHVAGAETLPHGTADPAVLDRIRRLNPAELYGEAVTGETTEVHA